MGQQILSQSKLYMGGYDLSGDLKAITLRLGADLQDNTSFASGGTHSRLAGLKTAAFQLEGFWNADSASPHADDVLFPNIGVNGLPVTIAPQTGAEGEVCYLLNANAADYTPAAKVGDMFGFSAGGETVSEVARGTLIRSALAAIVATGNGTIFNLGAVSAAQKVYAALHVLSITTPGAPSLAMKIQSAALVGFGSPTDRITFSAATGVGGQWATPLAGAITDAYWRCVFTLTNITSITLALSMGIQ